MVLSYFLSFCLSTFEIQGMVANIQLRIFYVHVAC